MEKTVNQKAWFLVLPVLVIVAFSAVIPLMTVVNYSVNDTFGNNEFFWAGLEWFEEMVTSDRLHQALGRQILFSAIILAIEVPLGIYIALNMPKGGFWASFCLVLMALPLLIPFNVVGTIWQIFGRVDIGLLGHTLAALGIDYNYTNDPLDAWITVVVMDVWHWTSLVALLVLCRPAIHPAGLLSGGQDRPGQPLGRVPLHRAAQDEGRAADRGAAAVHGQLHDLYRALRRHRRRPGNSTTFLSIDLVKMAVGQFDLGPAAAFSMMYFLVILLVSWVFYTVMTNLDREDGGPLMRSNPSGRRHGALSAVPAGADLLACEHEPQDQCRDHRRPSRCSRTT
jgi:glycerol transport system permease protein